MHLCWIIVGGALPMFMLIYALCYLPGHIVPELLFRCVTLAARNRNFGFRSRVGKFSTVIHLVARFRPRRYEPSVLPMCSLTSLVIPIVRSQESMIRSKYRKYRNITTLVSAKIRWIWIYFQYCINISLNWKVKNFIILFISFITIILFVYLVNECYERKIDVEIV